ncbi:hypothetical protein [Tunicatimonas pelagia]|uniref:hypothetical protein n=1 Tax=Tunicatimonas pelagia TaxID=931531 RepID=UPI0026671DEF|nr:hypothetical protein [Tunicatimonas pelagia]WKN45770.1 hypothetical protein P0M28_12460 [Tunicatimonas pelagia]
MLAYTFRVALCGMFLFLLFFSASAQKNQLYEGRYQNEIGEQGQARFYYDQPRRSEEKILDGDFYFTVTYTDSVKENLLIKKVYEGAYKENQKHGDWNYDFKEYEVILQDIEDVELKYNVNGNYINIRGTYDEGSPMGEWTYREDSMRNSEYLRTVRRGIANFRDGYLSGSFTFNKESEQDTYRVQGQFDENGRMNQQWEIWYRTDSTVVEESRTYRQGLLTSLVRIDQATGKVIDSLIYDEVIANLEKLKSTDTESLGFKVSRQGFGLLFDLGYPKGAVKKTRQRAGNNIIQRALNNFVSVDLQTNEIQGRKPVELAATSRFKYEISEEEQKAIEELNRKVDSLKAQISPLARNEAFELNRQRNDSLAHIFTYFSKLDSQLTVLDSVATFMSTPKYQYVDPQILFGDSLTFAKKTDTLNYVVDGGPRQYVVQLPGEPYDSVSLPVRLSQYVNDLMVFVPPRLAFVQGELTSIEQEGVNRALEEKISQKHKTVDSLYIRTGETPNSLESMIYQAFVDGRVNQLERRYSKANNFIIKQQIGDSIYAVLDTLHALHTPLDTIPEYAQLIDETYTEKTFDPYTFSYDFTRRAKKELYEKAAEQLYQYLLVQLAETRDYRQLIPRAKEIVALFDRLMELSKENTRKLERRLRRVRDPQEIKELIGLV